MLSVIWVLYSYNATYDRLNDSYFSHEVDVELNCVAEHRGELGVCDVLRPDNLPLIYAAQREFRIEAAWIAIAPVPPAWAGVYLLLFIVRWIRRGF